MWKQPVPNGGAAGAGSRELSKPDAKGKREKKVKPVRQESYPLRTVFERNDFSYIDTLLGWGKGRGRRGYAPSSLFMAMLFMVLKGIDSTLALVKFLRINPEWLTVLKLKRHDEGEERYMVPHRTTFGRLAKRIGVERTLEVFLSMVAMLMREGIIKARRISIDASIIRAWFKDCRKRKDEGHLKRCRHEKSRDKDASWGYDSYRKLFIYGYKIHIAMDTDTGLPMAVTVTAAGYGENRCMPWFVSVLRRLGCIVEKVFLDMAYDALNTRLLIVKVLKAIPFIPLNVKSCRGRTRKEKYRRKKKLVRKFYRKNFIMDYWVDPDSEAFDREFDVRTYSEQGFSIGRGSLNLDSLKHRGMGWATLHSIIVCTAMLTVARTAVSIGRPDLMRCVKCFTA